MKLIANLRREAVQSPESGIVAVANHGRGREGLIPLWVGEGDLSTPDFIRAAAQKVSLTERLSIPQAGIPELREALARYHARYFPLPLKPENFYVTGSGMHAIEMALTATVGAGEEAIYLSPARPNFVGAAGLAGVVPVPVELEFGANGWMLDPEKIAAAITPRTKALFINTPSNPTGWTSDRETLQFFSTLHASMVSGSLPTRFIPTSIMAAVVLHLSWILWSRMIASSSSIHSPRTGR